MTVLLVGKITFGQEMENATRYLVWLTDKDHNSFELSKPEQFLGERALARREKQQIAIDSLDLPVSSFYLDSIRSLGLAVLNTSKWMNTVTVASNDTLLIDTLTRVSFIDSVIQTKPVYLSGKEQETGLGTLPMYTETEYGNAWQQIHMLHGDFLHNQGYRGEGMHIAVMDAGFYKVDDLPAFDSLMQEGRLLGARDFVHDGRNLFKTGYHGMKVLSIIGGLIPGELIGTAPKASYYLFRTEELNTEYTVEEDNWISAAELADSAGVDILNTSLGYSQFYDTAQNYTYQDMNGETTRISRAATIASSRGMLVITSAGNEGDDQWKYITAPADAKDILTVGAVDYEGDYASFSSVGPTADGRIKPDVVAMGLNTMIQNQDGSVVPGSGTSYSCPVLTGVAACLWQAFPEKTNYQVMDAIRQSASRYASPDSLLGYGIPNFILAYRLLAGDEDSTGLARNPIHVFPNPFKTSFTIELFDVPDEKLTIAVYDSLGKQVYKEKHYPANQFLSHIPMEGLGHLVDGVYIVKIEGKTTRGELKIVKIY